MTPPRRRRSLSPTQFRFLYPATPLGSPGTNPIQPQPSQIDQAPQQAVSPQSSQLPVTPLATPHQPTTSTNTPSVQVLQTIDPSQLSTAMLYQTKPLSQQQQAYISQLPHTQGSLVCPTHHAAATQVNTTLPPAPRVAPMRPMDVAREWYLDYVSPQSIKFYNKAIEHLPGEKFNGTMLHTWLQILTDRAHTCAWTNILTIGGKLLTTNYADMSLKEVKAHAQEYQNEARRRAQNSEMLLQCLKSSISKTVYARLHQLQYKYTITREPEKEEIQDGVCYLKTLIDCYHVNTRSSTGEIRKKLAQLHLYMKHTAKGDIVQLCVYTRDLLARLRAAGEDTHDLLINLLEALKQAPNHHFQRWLNTRIDLWSTKQIDWQPDGSDLMQEAEGYYLELKTKNMWSRRTDGSLYVNSAEIEDQENAIMAGMQDREEPNWEQQPSLFGKDITALTLQLKKYNRNVNKKGKKEAHKWRYTAPKAGEMNTKVVRDNGMKKVYYWCEFHGQWTRHKPSECKKLPIKTREQRSASKTDYRQKKQAYMEAKATLQQFNISSDSEEETPQLFHDSDSDSNVSDSTEYYSEAEDSNTS